ncbi:four helix bundle protein [candidate division KSB1 bacterium]|nr:four helix bundle protein [candidate division KSB1 bacterium]
MRDFRTLNIWKEGISLVKNVYNLADLLPQEEKYGLKSQICRAAVSIPSNIAEGCSRLSQIDFERFLEIALGSAFEVETQLIIIEELELITKEQLSATFNQLTKLQKMINNLNSKLKANGK